MTGQRFSIGVIGVANEEKRGIEALTAEINLADLKIIESRVAARRFDFFAKSATTLKQFTEFYGLTAKTFSLTVVIPAFVLRDGRDRIDLGLLKYYLQAAERFIEENQKKSATDAN